MNIAELFVRLSADTSGLKKGMTDGAKSMDALRTVALRLGAVLGAGALFRGIIKNSIEAQAALAQLEARIQSTGGAAGRSVGQLTAHASALQSVTTFGDEAIQSAQALLLTFKRIRGEEFDRATEATLDLATAMGGDLKGAALQLGKALEDPVRGLTALRRSGVSFTEAQQDLIAKLVETGKVAEAQNLILDEMQTQFGGAAKAARNTLGGALQGLANAWGDAMEVSGAASAGIVGAINGIGEVIPAVRSRINSFFTLLQELSVNAAVNVERLRVGFIRLKIANENTMAEFGSPNAAADLAALAKELENAEAHLGFMEAAAIEVLAELYKLPPPLVALNTHLSGLDEVAEEAAIALGALTAANAAFLAANPVEKLAAAFDTGGINAPVLEGITVAAERARTTMEQLGDATVSMSGRGVDAFVDFASGAEDAMGNFVRAAMRDLAKLLARLVLVNVLKAAFAGSTGGLGGLVLGALETRASGGPVRGGRPYMVGERGPELFVPSGSGTIVPSGGGAAALLSSLPPIPRPMSPNEAAIHVWYREAFKLLAKDNSERG